jgi:hypothetical protein
MTTEQKTTMKRLELQLKRVMTMANNLNMQLSEAHLQHQIAISGIDVALSDIQEQLKTEQNVRFTPKWRN